LEIARANLVMHDISRNWSGSQVVIHSFIRLKPETMNRASSMWKCQNFIKFIYLILGNTIKLDPIGKHSYWNQTVKAYSLEAAGLVTRRQADTPTISRPPHKHRPPETLKVRESKWNRKFAQADSRNNGMCGPIRT